MTPIYSTSRLIPHLPELLLSLAAFLFLILDHRRRRRSFDLTTLNFPLIGALPHLFVHAGRLHDWITDVLRSGGYSVVLLPPSFAAYDILLTCDPANVRHVFTSHFANYSKGPDFADLFDILGGGIFSADSDSWKFQRRKAHGLVADLSFRTFVGGATREKLDHGLLPMLRSRAAAETAFDLQDIFLRFTFDTTCRFVFGVDPGCLAEGLPDVAFARALDHVEEALFYRHVLPLSWWKLMRLLRVGTEKRMAQATKVIDGFIADCITKGVQGAAKVDVENGEMGSDLLTSYLGTCDEIASQGVDFTKFLRDTTFNLLIAGRDTTSSALTWFFYLLSCHPSVESRILSELSLHADPSRLVYLHAALCESLRLFPPLPFEHKAAVHPDVLPSGHPVHPRRRILFSLYSMGRMEGIWGKDCAEFRPERWLSDSGKPQYVPSYKFFSFNSGPRTCLGKDIAFQQMKAVVAAIIARFRVESITEQSEVRPKISIFLRMKDGFMVRVTERENPVLGW
ncbi:hypothetical protein HPP92_023735 [Vanilla planifolia]|uniref:noroxomaritidine synthase n=1 Tax=Vanilla planifolia TaxID=51239 RepID=A0A835UBX3_VANPL|nr:hypothetical protein HPP92_024077 [Vanilla planifolia]KAG0455947.1 hypothetical protein HPP92_023735 [Vanilla planifolia]